MTPSNRTSRRTVLGAAGALAATAPLALPSAASADEPALPDFAPVPAAAFGPACNTEIVSDKRTSVLHLGRVAFDGSQGKEVLTLPIEQFANDVVDNLWGSAHALDLYAFDQKLALGVRTADPATNKFTVRVLRIDTTLIAP